MTLNLIRNPYSKPILAILLIALTYTASARKPIPLFACGSRLDRIGFAAKDYIPCPNEHRPMIMLRKKKGRRLALWMKPSPPQLN
jgi:hypothetical protein